MSEVRRSSFSIFRVTRCKHTFQHNNHAHNIRPQPPTDARTIKTMHTTMNKTHESDTNKCALLKRKAPHILIPMYSTMLHAHHCSWHSDDIRDRSDNSDSGSGSSAHPVWLSVAGLGIQQSGRSAFLPEEVNRTKRTRQPVRARIRTRWSPTCLAVRVPLPEQSLVELIFISLAIAVLRFRLKMRNLQCVSVRHKVLLN